MGNSKRRKQQDPFYGQSLITYTAIVRDEKTLETFADLDFQIERKPSIRETNIKAIAVVGSIFAHLQNPNDRDRQLFLQLALGEGSLQALADLLPDRPEQFGVYTSGPYIDLDNQAAGRNSDDFPGFSTEPVYHGGKVLEIQPLNLANLAV